MFLAQPWLITVPIFFSVLNDSFSNLRFALLADNISPRSLFKQHFKIASPLLLTLRPLVHFWSFPDFCWELHFFIPGGQSSVAFRVKKKMWRHLVSYTHIIDDFSHNSWIFNCLLNSVVNKGRLWRSYTVCDFLYLKCILFRLFQHW